MSGLAYLKEAALDCPTTDRYDRSVCHVMVSPASAPADPKTLDAGPAMVTIGMAWRYRAYARADTARARAVGVC